MKKLSKQSLVLYLFSTLIILLTRDIVHGQFAFGVFVASAFITTPWFFAVVYVLAGLFFGTEVLLARLIAAAVIVLAFLFHRLIKRPVAKWTLVLYMLLANVYFMMMDTEASQILPKLVSVAASLAFAFVGIYTIKALFTRPNVNRPTFDELVCIALFFTVVSYCLASLNVGIYNMLMVVAPFAILFMLCAFGNETGLVGAVFISLSGLFSAGDFSQFALYILMSLSALVFNKINRFAAGISLIITNVLLAYFFNIYGTFDIFVLIPTIASVVLFFMIPARLLKRVADLYGTHVQYAGKSIVNKLRQNLAHKLYNLSDVFFSMKNTFVAMTGSGITHDQAKVAIVRQICDSVCSDCAKKNNCWRANMNSTENSLLQLTECALSSGKATILDINGNLTVNCDRVGLVLSSINSQSEGLMSHITRAKEADNNRLLIGEQLGGVSKIMQQLALDCKGKMSFNNLKEKDIADKLTFHNVLCSEAVFIEQNSGVLVILTVAARDLDSAVIASVVSEAVKLSMKIDKVEPCESPNWMTVYMSNEARFKLSYGIRNYTKANSTVSGDTHSFNNLENNRFMLAICDGMGSGTQAENMSTTAITLVENFYRAGFDSDVILTCTNKLLSGFDSEVFTAVDIAVVDLNNGLCDFIKLGAPDGLVKINGEVQYVSGSSLPLGVLDEMKPSVTKTILKSGDFVVLASDGFWESFKTTDTVADFLHNNVATNPQVVADDLMERALSNCKHTPKDDMTLIVARLV